MLQGFEDAFMEAQSSVIALALELLEIGEKSADVICVYMYQSPTQLFNNTFFIKDGKVCVLNDWFNDDQINEYFDCCDEDLENIISVCEEYEADCPCEFRLRYDVNSGSLDTRYKYDDVAAENDLDLVDIYFDWKNDLGRL